MEKGQLIKQDKRIAERFGANEIKFNPYFDMVAGTPVFQFRISETVVKFSRTDFNSLSDLTLYDCYSFLISCGSAKLTLRFTKEYLENCEPKKLIKMIDDEANRIKGLSTKSIPANHRQIKDSR